MRPLITLFLALIVSACASVSAPPSGMAPEPADSEAPIYSIGAGDQLTISVWGNPDLSLSVPVRPDGYISMPLIGDIKASELDAETLAANITEQLGTQVRSPQVTVIVAQVNSIQYSNRVRVTGAVRAPRSIPYARGMSVLDAVLEAGGVNEVASSNRARLYRVVDGALQEFEVRLDDILLRGQLETNYPMRPGDVITVPERLF